jgi:hypothetical protein
MAIVVRYFSTTSAGNRDGTSWANRARLFVSNITVNPGTWGGPMHPGETATQTGTGATGVVEWGPGVGNVLSLSGITGSPNATGLWTGNTSGESVTPTAAPSNNQWSPAITRFDFGGSDALECRIGPGSYTCSQTLAGSAFTTAPTIAKPLFLFGSDSSGNRLTPPYGWTSDSGDLDHSQMPVIATGSNIAILNQISATATMLRLESAQVSRIVDRVGLEWCSVLQTAGNTSTVTVLAGDRRPVRNCTIEIQAAQYDYVMSTASNIHTHNCRLRGTSGTSGLRAGIGLVGPGGNDTGAPIVEQCTVIGVGGPGILLASSSASGSGHVRRCVVYGVGGHGFSGRTTSGQTNLSTVENCVAVNCGGFGIKAEQSHIFVRNTRLRDNTSGNFDGLANYPTDLDNITSAGTDAAEFVDAAGGDFRIKSTCSWAGRDIGVSEQASSSVPQRVFAF